MVLKLLENLREFGNFRKTLETVQKSFPDDFIIFSKFAENLRKSLEVFAILRKFSSNFRNGSKIFFR